MYVHSYKVKALPTATVYLLHVFDKMSNNILFFKLHSSLQYLKIPCLELYVVYMMMIIPNTDYNFIII